MPRFQASKRVQIRWSLPCKGAHGSEVGEGAFRVLVPVGPSSSNAPRRWAFLNCYPSTLHSIAVSCFLFSPPYRPHPPHHALRTASPTKPRGTRTSTRLGTPFGSLAEHHHYTQSYLRRAVEPEKIYFALSRGGQRRPLRNIVLHPPLSRAIETATATATKPVTRPFRLQKLFR